jgi:hypothetical protein
MNRSSEAINESVTNQMPRADDRDINETAA